MKKKLLTALCLLTLPVPWTILPLRARFPWALEWAWLMIPCYAAFMVLSGVLTALAYTKGGVRGPLMKLCLAVDLAYAAFGAAALLLLLGQRWL